MDNHLSPGKSAKPYFLVARPAHFRFRPDLPEELCVAESMIRLLPRSEERHKEWLRICGHSAKEFPLAKMVARAGKPYQLTSRYVLQAVVLPGNSQHTNLITDGNLWSLACEYGGLFQFVIDRAVELSVFLGLKPETAQAMFVAAVGPGPATTRGYSRWAVGYECASGLCTILAADHAGTTRTFLEGRYGYFTPLQKPV
jgi:hypothetical protein